MEEMLIIFAGLFAFVVAMRILAWSYKRDWQRERDAERKKWEDAFWCGGGGRMT